MSKLYYLDSKDIVDNLGSTDAYKVLSANQGNQISTALTGKQDTLTAGSNIAISENTISATDTTYSVATASADGLMSSTDKIKLDNAAERIYEGSTIEYFISTTTGNDENDGKTGANAVATIQHAIDILPKFINTNISLVIDPGTYNEDIIISGFIGTGKITFTPYNPVTINSISIINNSVNIHMQSLTLTTTTTTALLIDNSRGYISMYACGLSGNTISAQKAGIRINQSPITMFIEVCIIDNKYIAIDCEYSGNISIGGIEGAGNTIGYRSYGSLIFVDPDLGATNLYSGNGLFILPTGQIPT